MAGHVDCLKNYTGERGRAGAEELESDSWRGFELPINNSWREREAANPRNFFFPARGFQRKIGLTYIKKIHISSNHFSVKSHFICSHLL